MSPWHFGSLALAAALSLGVGYLLQRTQSRAAAWLFVLGTVVVTDQALGDEDARFRMIGLLVLMAYAMKALVAVEARRLGQAPLAPGRWLVFAGVWLGMQPREFARRLPALPARGIAVASLAWVGAGAVTIVLAQQLSAWLGPDHLQTTGFLFLAGCSMALHFGFIGLIASGLRGLGFDVDPQFRAPWRSVSLQEFWARRWNVGFSVMTTMAIYRPATSVAGRRGALALSFLASGLLHELACSLPVGAGYGLPTLYFALHAIAIAIERALLRHGFGLRGWWGRAWVLLWVLLPVPLLFHAPFLRGIVLPLL